MKTAKWVGFAALAAVAATTWAKAPLVPLHNIHFDKLVASGGSLDPLDPKANTGSAKIPFTLKYHPGQNYIPTTMGSDGKPYHDPVHGYSIQENAWSSLWLVGDGEEGLGCSYKTGFTLSFWVKPPKTTGSWSDFLGFRLGTEDYTFEYCNTTASFQIYTQSGCAFGTLDYMGTAASAPTKTNEWNHFCLVWKPYLSWRGDPKHFGELWVNGSLVGRVRPTSSANGPLQELHLGGWERRNGADRSSSSNSALADICVYGQAISDDDVQWLYKHVRGSIPRGREATLNLHLERGNDYVGFDNNGTLTNQFYYVNGGYTLTPFVGGALGSKYGLWVAGWNGKWIDGDETTGLGCSTATGFTLSYWSRPTSQSNSWSDLFSFGLGNGNCNIRHEFCNSTGTFAYYGNCGGNGQKAISNDTWHHHVIVWNPATQKCDAYVDGTLTWNLTVGNNDTGVFRRFYIGPSVRNENGGMRTQGEAKGGLDEVALFNFSATADEIAWLKANKPKLPPLAATTLARTVSGDCSWDGFAANWTVDATTRKLVWPAGEDDALTATLTANGDANLTVDTVVRAQLVFAGASGTAVNLALAKDCVFAPASMAVAAGLNVTVPVATKVAGTMTLGADSKIKLDVSTLHAGDEMVLTVGEFALPEDEEDVLSHIELFGGEGVTAALSEDGKSIVLVGLLPDTTRKIVTGTESLDADADWTSYSTVIFTNGAKLDLKGHALTLAGFESTVGESAEITDSVGGGRLILDVPEGAVVRNKSVKLTGKLHLVKNGAGRYVTYVNGSYFTGGTELNAGTTALQTDVGYSCPLGAEDNRWVQVNSGAVFDIAGVTDLSTVWLSLNGGTIVNSAGKTTKNIVSFPNIPLLYTVRLEADSTMDFANSYGFCGAGANGGTSLDLAGHKLTVNLQGDNTIFYLNNCPITAGEIAVNGGYFKIGPNGAKGVYGPEVKLTANSAFCIMENAVGTFGDFAALNTAQLANGFSNGVVKVSGTFTPTGTNFPHVELQDGATVDLSGRTGTVSAASYHKNGAITNYLTVANGATTVYVKLEGRTDLETLVTSASPYLIKWDGAPQPCVRFRPDAATKNLWTLRADETGLKILPHQGCMFLIW